MIWHFAAIRALMTIAVEPWWFDSLARSGRRPQDGRGALDRQEEDTKPASCPQRPALRVVRTPD